MSARSLVRLTESGLYCEPGDFYIDPWRPVRRAIITHAHGDHARPGSRSYLTAWAGLPVLRERLGQLARLEATHYAEARLINGVRVSLHPAGHILGSAQVRIEHAGEVWVISGDYKTEPDRTCAPLEPLRCHTFITESTFGLPVYRWPGPDSAFADIQAWWRSNQAAGKASVLFAYALGKAQRLLAGLDASLGPVYVHGAIDRINRAYQAAGVELPAVQYASEAGKGVDWSRALIVAPTSAQGTPWLRKFGDVSTGYVSGWMRIRGARRRLSLDRGFILSDHADWPGLMSVIEATGAERVWATHGYAAVVARWLRENGREAQALDTQFEGERDDVVEG